MDVQWLPDAYESANAGDWDPFVSRLSPDYRHHVPALGFEWTGPDEAVKGLREVYESGNVTQRAVDVAQHGDFVLVSVAVRSDRSPEPVSAVHVLRVEGDRVVEMWAHYPPIS